MAMAWEPTSPADSGSEGLCPTATWMSPLLRESLRSASKLLTASTPRRSCFQDSSRTTMRRSPGSASRSRRRGDPPDHQLAGNILTRQVTHGSQEDVTEPAEVPGTLTKTAQEADGEIRGLPYRSHPATCPVRAWRAWIDASGIDTGPAFGDANPLDAIEFEDAPVCRSRVPSASRAPQPAIPAPQPRPRTLTNYTSSESESSPRLCTRGSAFRSGQTEPTYSVPYTPRDSARTRSRLPKQVWPPTHTDEIGAGLDQAKTVAKVSLVSDDFMIDFLRRCRSG